MINLRSMLPVLMFAFVFLGIPALADAQATRTWVSGVGDDVNPCSRTAPCKTFAGAITKTATNGEINCLDGGGFGAVTITKSITIDCTNEVGSILAAGVNGITINITLATDTAKSVRLRGLSINGASTGLNGVRVISGNRLVVEDSVIDGFTSHGISMENTSGVTRLIVNDSTIRNNVGNGINTFFTGTATGTLDVSRSLITGTNIAYNLGANANAVIMDSKLVANTTGILANSAIVAANRCEISHNTTGVQAGAGTTMRLNGNSITANATGLNPAGGSIISLGNNMIRGNTANGAPTSLETLN